MAYGLKACSCHPLNTYNVSNFWNLANAFSSNVAIAFLEIFLKGKKNSNTVNFQIHQKENLTIRYWQDFVS